MRKFCFFLFAFTFMVANGFAQKVYKDFQDGRIWVKVKSSFNPKTGEYSVPDKKISVLNLPFYYPLDKKFGITYVGKAFAVNTNNKLDNVLEIKFSKPALVDELLYALKADRFVEYAEKIPLNKIDLNPNDPQIESQWFLNKINATSAWNYASSGSSIVIAIVDDAIQRNHPDLLPNIWVNPGEIANNNIDDDGNGYIDDINGWDVASNTNQVDPPSNAFDHGTHVAGIASAATNNGVGIASIGFSCKIMCVKSTNSANSISDGYTGILYAANTGAKVINMSWGGNTFSETASGVIEYALSKGCILVASAGNDNSSSLKYPAAYDGVISVASTNINDQKSDFSNFGSWVKISAPGSSIYSTTVGGTYGNKDGTSMSSPLVAGLIGLMKTLNPTMPNADLIQCLYSTADNINASNESYLGQLGAGRINANAAMACMAAGFSRAPIADFSANNINITKGSSVTFSDLSGYSPTSWEWSFLGGIPATFNGQKPPAIKYDNTGQYTVTLKVTNANGNNTATKTNYITVSEPPTCLTVNLPFPEWWQTALYSSGAGGSNGFVNGINGDGDKQKAMFFNLSGTANTTLTSVALGFARAYSNDPNKIVTVRVFSYNGATGLPGTQLGSQNILMSEIMQDVTAGNLSLVDFTQSITLPPSKFFFVSVDISNLSWTPDSGIKDTLALYCTVPDQANQPTTPIFELGSDNIWRRYGTSGSWNLPNSNLLIHPFVTDRPAKSILNPKNPVVCSGNTVEFSAAGSTYGDIFQWQLEGVTPPVVINNQLTINPFYPNAGSYKAYLLTRGGCLEVRVDSAIVTVNASPDITINSSKNPICSGETASLTASGATTYEWTPTTGLNVATGNQVQASPNVSTTYNIKGVSGNCSATIPFELFVRGRTAEVVITASQTAITTPTPVTFTAQQTNGGNNPIFNFLVNSTSRQSGSSSQFQFTVSPGDVVNCQLTSNEACVDNKTVGSNTITMENPLPITLLEFSGVKGSDGNKLAWITSGETNSDRFELEKSFEGKQFEKITTIAAAGNSINNRFYNYLDQKPLSGQNAYRLKMIDRDGSFKFSNVVLLDNKGIELVTSLSPNPTYGGSMAILSILNGERGNAFITVTTATGQIVQTQKINNRTGNIQINLSASKLAAGLYFINYSNKEGNILNTLRWVVVN